MYKPTIITWIILLFGLITCLPLLFAQLIILIDSHGLRAKDILIGKGEEWRDKTHFKSAYSLAIADWLIFFPIFILSIIGILLSNFWSYILLSVVGAIQLYINVFLWFFEKKICLSFKRSTKILYISLGKFYLLGNCINDLWNNKN